VASFFTPEKLVIPVLISQSDKKLKLHTLLEKRFGSIDYVSEEIDFDFTHYYDEEMGPPIKRYFISFSELVDPARLGRIKIESGQVEDNFRVSGKRKINLDPGLLALSRFVLASRKEGSHRVPLAGGVYAEITLLYERGEFRPVEWTYPDYRSRKYRDILAEIRDRYHAQSKQRT
jgi:hypothetical protein